MAKKDQKPSAQKRLPEGYTRKTYVVKNDLVEKVERYAYWGRLKIQDVVNTALAEYLKDKNTRPIPSK